MARAIDADALHKRLYKEFDHNSRVVGKQAVASAWQGAMQLLYDAPTIDPVKHGKWELKHIGVGHYWECSVCHTNPCIYVTKDTKFCPNCGARMDGE